jgi:ELWxxDGT repeat protein
MLADVQPGPMPSRPSTPAVLRDDLAVFAADDGVHGAELWRTDGTIAGTQRLTDLAPGAAPGAASTYGAAGHAFFMGSPGAARVLYASDGTSAGTLALPLLTEPATGPSHPSQFAAVGSRVVFVADDGVHGSELWWFDPARPVPSMVTDLWPGASAGASELASLGSRAVFVGHDADHGIQLWATDGTDRGTTRLDDIVSTGLSDLTACAGRVYALDTEGADHVLRSTDGLGPSIVNARVTTMLFPRILRAFPDHLLLYWVDRDGSGLFTLATRPGAQPVRVGPANMDVRRESITLVGDALYFTTFVPLGLPAHDPEGLYRSDRMGLARFVHHFGPDTVFTDHGQTGIVYTREIYRLDGDVPTLESTIGPPWGSGVVALHGVSHFLGGNGASGEGLWRFDLGGQLARVASVGLETWPAMGAAPIAFADHIVFWGADPEHGAEVWASDGTPGGTHVVRDVAPAGASSGAGGSGFTTIGDVVYLSLDDGTHGIEPWRLYRR